MDLKRDINNHPDRYRQDVRVRLGYSDLFLWVRDMLSNAKIDTVEIPDWVSRYVSEWDHNTVVYLPWSIRVGHWAVVELNIPIWKIQIYDSLRSKRYDRSFKRCGRLMRRLLEDSVSGQFTDCPQLMDPARPSFETSLTKESS